MNTKITIDNNPVVAALAGKFMNKEITLGNVFSDDNLALELFRRLYRMKDKNPQFKQIVLGDDNRYSKFYDFEYFFEFVYVNFELLAHPDKGYLNYTQQAFDRMQSLIKSISRKDFVEITLKKSRPTVFFESEYFSKSWCRDQVNSILKEVVVSPTQHANISMYLSSASSKMDCVEMILSLYGINNAFVECKKQEGNPRRDVRSIVEVELTSLMQVMNKDVSEQWIDFIVDEIRKDGGAVDVLDVDELWNLI